MIRIDRQLENIINGASVDDEITSILNEGAFEKLKDFAKSKKWKNNLIRLGLGAGVAYVAYKILKKGSGCQNEIETYMRFLVQEFYRVAKREGTRATVELIRAAVKSSTGSSVLADVLASTARRIIDRLVASIPDDREPTADEIKKAVADELPPVTGDSSRLDVIRKAVMSRGRTVRMKQSSSASSIGQEVKGTGAWSIYLKRIYKWGVDAKMPLCILLLINSREGRGTLGLDVSLEGVSERVLRKEFKHYLYTEDGEFILEGYPEDYPAFDMGSTNT